MFKAIFGRALYTLYEEYVGKSELVDTILIILGTVFLCFLGYVFLKIFIDEVIFQKCVHGVKFGYTKKKCEACTNGVHKNVEPKINPSGICKSCGSQVKSRYRHQVIKPGQSLEYNTDEIDTFVNENRLGPLFKQQLHLRHYPPELYWLDYCDECFCSKDLNRYNMKYKFAKWGESLLRAFAYYWWIVLLALAFGWIKFINDLWVIVLGYFVMILLSRYLFGLEVTSRIQQARSDLSKANSVHTEILKALDFIKKIDEEAAAAKEKIRILRESRINDIDKMSGVQFEEHLAYFFSRLGYKVKGTSTTGDQGVDLILKKNNETIAIQAKRYDPSKSVGNSAIQEVIAGKIIYDCSDGWVITTSYFTKSAIQLASKAGIRLIDREKLIKMLSDVEREDQFDVV
ncbi:restriction endonuclease [Cohnella zeiphila]|uniref:restriction endonuclease n=1 Tax=Cohnella zeiphila TaxID=2761120 RepID=UPI0030801D00